MATSQIPFPAPRKRAPALGKIFNQYRIEEFLGEGASGTVFRAHDLRLRRQVAIKLYPKLDQVAWAQMLNEARAISRLNHPGFCAIYEVAEDEGQVYIAMEYVAGHPLKSLLAGKGLPRELILLYGAQLAAALAHAHERRIIHRDIKSSNVIVKTNGTVKLLDLGLALRRPFKQQMEEYTSAVSLEDIGPTGGTLPYSAPELLRGERASTQTDIWAFGVLLYEMTKGSLPFTGRTCFELSMDIMAGENPPLPRQAGSRLAAIVRRCLQKDCSRRYSSAREVLGDIDSMLLGYRQRLSMVHSVS